MKLDSNVPERNKFELIQVLRFVAALMVIITHCSFYTHERLAEDFPVFRRGWNGVRLFFAISGFVMMISSEKLFGKSENWKVFARKRIIRIVPAYWIVTLGKIIVLFVASSLVLHNTFEVGKAVKSLLFIPYTNGDGELKPLHGVGWTLNFEMFFYLLFALAIFFRINVIAFLAVVLVPLGIISLFRSPGWPDIRFYADAAVLDFLYGVIAARLLQKRITLPRGLSVVLIILGCLDLFLPKSSLISTGAYSLLDGLAAFAVVYGAASIEKPGMRVPELFVYLGGASYSLYLIHPIVSPAIPAILKKIHFVHPVISLIGAIALGMGCGVLFYKFIEKPLTAFFTNLTKKSRPSEKSGILKSVSE